MLLAKRRSRAASALAERRRLEDEAQVRRRVEEIAARCSSSSRHERPSALDRLRDVRQRILVRIEVGAASIAASCALIF
jgi:hypothetical protein